jgi:hypothetical protein
MIECNPNVIARSLNAYLGLDAPGGFPCLLLRVYTLADYFDRIPVPFL